VKSNIISLTIAIIAGIPTLCQSIKIPDAVKNAFANKFSNVTNVKWGKENPKEYEAEFKFNNTSISANFDLDGNWIETETVIPVSDLPAAVSTSIAKKYSGAIIIMAEKLEMPGGKILYETSFNVKNKKKSIELNPDGSFVQ